MLPWSAFALAVAIVVVAAIVQSTTGMGFGLVSAPLLALIDVDLVPVPVIMLGVATATHAAIREKGAIRWNEVWTGLVGRVAGALLAGLVLLVLHDRAGFSLAFGISILIVVALSIAGAVLPLTRWTLIAMGTISGLTGTITSVGAPPMAIIYQSVDPARARPTLSAFFSIGALVSFLVLLASGRVGAHALLATAFLAPAMYVGIRLAPYCREWIDRRFRWIALALSTAAAIRLIIAGSLGLMG